MSKVMENPNPKWWRDLSDDEYKVTAYAYVKAHFDVHIAVSNILQDGRLAEDVKSVAILSANIADWFELQIKDDPDLKKLSNPPTLHATMYATHAFGLEKLQAAITGFKWIELITEHVQEKDAPVAPIISAVETLPSGADVEMLKQALIEAFTKSLEMPKTRSNPPIVVTTIDLWIKKLTGKRFSDHTEFVSEQFSDFAEPQALGIMIAITSKVAGHMNGFITDRKERRVEQLHARRGGRRELVSAHSKLDLPRGTQRPGTTELLEKMHRTLLRHKEESASLLKTHMYLVDCAYRHGGDSPTFTVNMDGLLEAKGYKRRADGSFQASTYREEWGRIATLAGCYLVLRRVNEKNKRGKEETFIEETPYWEVRARLRLEEGEALGLEPILLENPDAPIIKAVVMQPGLWWAVSDRGTMNYKLPREVLALPTDGKGNETQRMAVQLAATLALWVRSSQQQHAGGECRYSVGALLEASGVKTRLEFERMHRKDSARLRKYLAGEVGDDDPRGALYHLTSLGAFDVRIQDEADFWASGRGWQTRFWEAQLSVEIPNLGIRRLEEPQKKKRRSAT